MSDRPVLELVDVSKRYIAPSGPQEEVLTQVSLRVGAGQSVAVVGPSGSGKSTLLNISGSLDTPTSGQVIIDGENLSGLNESALAEIRNRKVGFVFQLHHLLPQCTVLENALVPALAADSRADIEVAERAEMLLSRVGLADRMHYRPGSISGGERQRAAVVRALVNRPRLLLADEPTGSLDRSSAESLAELLLEINRDDGVTLVVVTHSESLARRMQDVYALRNGKLQPFGDAR
jgi:ABC-type lipoprotein export system ATPase subunit